MNAHTQEIVANMATVDLSIPAASPVVATPGYDDLIARAVMDPTFDLARLERLIALKDASMAKASREAFNRDMVAVQGQIGPVVRNADNDQTKSKYATLDKIGAAIDPVIFDHGFALSFSTDASPMQNCYRVICRTRHRDGHEQIDHLDVPIDGAGARGNVNKTATHALGSTISYGRRYLTMMIFNVKTRVGDDDDDGNAAGGQVRTVIGSDDAAYVRGLLASTNSDENKFLAFIKSRSIEELTPDQFKRAIDVLNRKAHGAKQ